MREEIINIFKPNSKPQQFALAIVTKTWGSSPRPVGSLLFMAKDGALYGSVSGGCVEGAVAKVGQEVMATQQSRVLSFGISDDDAWSVGLSCGGNLEVLVVPFSTDIMGDAFAQWAHESAGGVCMTPLSIGAPNMVFWRSSGDFLSEKQDFDPVLKQFLNENAQSVYQSRRTQTITAPDGTPWFLNLLPPKPRLIIIGATHVTTHLVHLAHYYDFETIVIDPRAFFTRNVVFNTPPTKILTEWSAEILPNMTLDAYTFAVLLTHDAKIDDQALALLLPSEVAYIGALGSRKTHEKRVTRLLNAGYTEGVISRISAPVGVDIQAKSAAEIALSIMGEIIKVKNGG